MPNAPECPFDKIEKGNLDFLINQRRRREVITHAHEQHPTALILSCIDSRNPETVFGIKKLGEFLVVRSSGNTLTEGVRTAFMLAITKLGIRSIAIIGHKGCGAIASSMEGSNSSDHMNRLVRHMELPIQAALSLFSTKKLSGNDRRLLIDYAAYLNVAHTIQLIYSDSELSEAVKVNQVTIRGGVYDTKEPAPFKFWSERDKAYWTEVLNHDSETFQKERQTQPSKL